MSKNTNVCPLIFPFIIGIVLGTIAKFVDGRDFIYYFPVFADIMGRFGIWVWTATLIAIRSKKPLFAAIRSLSFFIGMLLAYYGYTVLFLHFFPKSQIILWGIIAAVTPFCGFLIWHIRKKSHYTNFISSLPFTIFFTEWYLTAFTVRDWAFRTTRDELLFGIAYLCFTFSMLAVIPTNKKRLFSLFFGLLLSIILIRISTELSV